MMPMKAPAVEPCGPFCRNQTAGPQGPRAQQGGSLSALQGQEMSPVDGEAGSLGRPGGPREAEGTRLQLFGWNCG